LRGRIFVVFMVESAALLLIAAMAVNDNVATQRILVLYELAVSGKETSNIRANRPRPLDLGEPT
jgi:hypothetical protein